MTEWKRWFAKSLWFGAGFALVLVIIASISTWLYSRPKQTKPWNRSAIKASFDRVDCKDNGLDFFYLLDNTTDNDLRLTEGSKPDVALKLSNTTSLFGFGSENIKLQLPIYVPARHRTRVLITISGYKVDVPDPGTNATQEQRENYYKKVAGQVAKTTPNLGGFEVFINEERLEIDMPKGW